MKKTGILVYELDFTPRQLSINAIKYQGFLVNDATFASQHILCLALTFCRLSKHFNTVLNRKRSHTNRYREKRCLVLNKQDCCMFRQARNSDVNWATCSGNLKPKHDKTDTYDSGCFPRGSAKLFFQFYCITEKH